MTIIHDSDTSVHSLSISCAAVRPVAVHILTKEKFVSADKTYDMECKSSGSRPEAAITWWMGTRQIKRLAKHVRISLLPTSCCTSSAATLRIE